MKLKIIKATYTYEQNYQLPFHFSVVFESIVLGENRGLKFYTNNLILYIRDRNFS